MTGGQATTGGRAILLLAHVAAVHDAGGAEVRCPSLVVRHVVLRTPSGHVQAEGLEPPGRARHLLYSASAPFSSQQARWYHTRKNKRLLPLTICVRNRYFICESAHQDRAAESSLTKKSGVSSEQARAEGRRRGPPPLTWCSARRTPPNSSSRLRSTGLNRGQSTITFPPDGRTMR